MNSWKDKQKLRIALPSGLLASILVLSFVAAVQLVSTTNSNVAYAQTVTQVNGVSDGNTVTCPNGQVLRTGLNEFGSGFLNFLLSFSASGTSGSMTGTWTISGFYSGGIAGGDATITKSGTITGGKVSGNHVVLTGVENVDNLCGGPVPSDIRITGTCQPDNRVSTKVNFQAKNGEIYTSSFGKVTCTKS
jgi:hypothetical protein